MKPDREYSLADIAVKLQLPIELILAAKFSLRIWPTRRDKMGQPFFNQRALSLFHRLLVEKDGSALFEPHEPGAMKRYFRSQGIELTTRPMTADENDFLELLLRDPDAAEAQLNQEP